MPKPDYAHKWTDKRLAALEKRIAAEFKQAADELTATVNAYFAAFVKRDAEMAAKVEAGEITEQQYKQWRLAQIGRGKRFEALRDKVAERYTNAHEVAVAYANDATPGIYTLNRNYAAYTIEQISDKADFTLWDEQTVRRLIDEQPGLMPYYPPKRALKRGIDLDYGKKQITASITSSILQGKSISRIADDMQQRMESMNRASAIRTARTSVTAAQNAGRMDSYAAAEKMGIKLKKEWLATLDGRTRHAHAMLDGQTAETDKPFHVDGYEIMYPGDTSAPGYLVYNCRCTLIAALDDAPKAPNPLRRARDPETGKSILVSDMTYAQWESWKKSENRYVWDTYIKKGKKLSSDRAQWAEYKSVLGKNVPGTLDSFQNLKYNEPEKWARLKTDKRQTDFVNNAPCVTTPKKFTGYFLKSGAKHADQFFNVGYTENDVLQLRYDIARQFDMQKAQDFRKLQDGSEKFSMYMQLGIDGKEKSFLVCWISEPGKDKPRITTAYRKDVPNND